MLELKNINISFDKKECIRNSHFQAYDGQITGIYGESGTGKSSLLYILGMLSNQQHEYYYNEQRLEYSDKEKLEFRNQHISFITQNSLLIEAISVEKNIEFYLLQSQVQYSVDELLDMVKLTDKKNAMPNSLSGGERQRVAIACAIAKDSDIILGDELTSALDENNKKIVMDLLKECARQGKIVILVSHERNIIEQCDRLYKLDHLELILEKDSEETNISHIEKSKKEIKLLEMFELLFHSNRKYNWRRVIISFIVMSILFLSTSMFVKGYQSQNEGEHSLDNVSDRKLLVYNDESGGYRYDEGYVYGIELSNYAPISKDNIKKINNLESIEHIYDYYIFDNTVFNEHGRWNNMSLIGKRNGKIIEKRESSDEFYIDDSEYEFTVVPIYPEESIYQKESNNIYVNERLAYINNLEVGDTLELELCVPYAFAKSVGTDRNEETGKSYYDYYCFGEKVKYKTKVAGIIKSNAIYDNCIYMKYDIMKQMIDKQVQRYKNNEIKIDYQAFNGYSTIEDLEPYAKMVFVDKSENVLKVQNQINNISEDVYAYNEYQTVLKVMEEEAKMAKHTFVLTCVGIVIFIIGGVIVELFYLKKYKTTYMMMNLIGYDKKEKNKLLCIHTLWQMMIMLCMSGIVYITATLPDILQGLHIMKYEDAMYYVNEIYNYYMAYCGFSRTHLMIFVLLIIVIISIVNLLMKRHYDKQDLVTWIRGG